MFLNKLFKDKEGLTSVEYEIAGALITSVLMGAFIILSVAIASQIDRVTNVVISVL